MAMVMLGTLGFIVYDGYANPKYQLAPTIDPAGLIEPTLINFPATWTPEPTVTNFPPGPSMTPVPTQTPMPTITRMPTSRAVVTVQPWQQGVEPSTIGLSVKGRPLQVFRFGNGPSGRMIIAGIHGGNEWNTVALADQLIAHIQADPGLIPPEISLYILRVLNPDGLDRALSASGRTNEHNVDLNRNWPGNWQPDWLRDGCWDYLPTSGGTEPASEPETQALMHFILETPLDALINYHSAAMGIFPGGLPPTEGSLRLASAIDEVTDYPYPPMDTGCVYTGAMVDWTSMQGIASVDLELENHRDTDFDVNLEVLNVLLSFVK
jgi:predicted deacylase